MAYETIEDGSSVALYFFRYAFSPLIEADDDEEEDETPLNDAFGES